MCVRREGSRSSDTPGLNRLLLDSCMAGCKFETIISTLAGMQAAKGRRDLTLPPKLINIDVSTNIKDPYPRYQPSPPTFEAYLKRGNMLLTDVHYTGKGDREMVKWMMDQVVRANDDALQGFPSGAWNRGSIAMPVPSYESATIRAIDSGYLRFIRVSWLLDGQTNDYLPRRTELEISCPDVVLNNPALSTAEQSRLVTELAKVIKVAPTIIEVSVDDDGLLHA